MSLISLTLLSATERKERGGRKEGKWVGVVKNNSICCPSASVDCLLCSGVFLLFVSLLGFLFVGCLLALCPSNMLMYLRDGPAQARVHVATLRQMLQITLS